MGPGGDLCPPRCPLPCPGKPEPGGSRGDASWTVGPTRKRDPQLLCAGRRTPPALPSEALMATCWRLRRETAPRKHRWSHSRRNTTRTQSPGQRDGRCVARAEAGVREIQLRRRIPSGETPGRRSTSPCLLSCPSDADVNETTSDDAGRFLTKFRSLPRAPAAPGGRRLCHCADSQLSAGRPSIRIPALTFVTLVSLEITKLSSSK